MVLIMRAFVIKGLHEFRPFLMGAKEHLP